MAYIKIQPRTQIKTGRDMAPITLDGGVNRHGTVFNIASNEAWDCNNTTSKIPGVLSVKPNDLNLLVKLPDGTNNLTYDNMFGIGSYSFSSSSMDRIVFLAKDPDNPTSYYYVSYDPLNQTFSKNLMPYSYDRESAIITFRTDVDRYDIICNLAGVFESKNGSSFNKITNAPITNIFTIDDYRLFALKGNVLSWCDPDDIYNWSTGDAGQVVLYDMDGEGKALITLNDSVIAFSNKSMHILYGDDTGNYQISSKLNHGCVGFRTIAKRNNAIYFLDFDGLKVYSDGIVNKVSNKIDYWLKDLYSISFDSLDRNPYAVMTIHKEYLYLSVPYGDIPYNTPSKKTHNTITFELNLDTGIFNIWDVGYKGFTSIGNKFYGINDAFVEIGNTNTHTTSWHHITPMRRSQFNKQTISSIPVLLTLPTGSTLKVAYNTNDTTPSWTDLYTFTPNNVSQEVIIDVPMTVLNNNMMYQLKFYGTGPCTIHEIGSDGRVIIR